VDITLGIPIGGFRWRGSIPGDLCGAKVSWACDYASTEPVAIPPFIDTFGAHVIVTNMLANAPDGCAALPAYVSPGVLTLTPTVTCPNPDPEGDPVATVLDPLYLTITEGTCGSSAPACVDTLCPFPENPGFESGLIDWAYSDATIDTGIVLSGTNSVKLNSVGSYVEQEKSGACPSVGMFLVLRCNVYSAGAPGEVKLSILQYSDTTLLDTHTESAAIGANAWYLPSTYVIYHPGMNKIKIRIEANNPDIYVDDVSVNHCS